MHLVNKQYLIFRLFSFKRPTVLDLHGHLSVPTHRRFSCSNGKGNGDCKPFIHEIIQQFAMRGHCPKNYSHFAILFGQPWCSGQTKYRTDICLSHLDGKSKDHETRLGSKFVRSIIKTVGYEKSGWWPTLEKCLRLMSNFLLGMLKGSRAGE